MKHGQAKAGKEYNMEINKIGNVELTADEARRYYENGKYIVTYSKIYSLHWSNAQQKVYGTVVYEKPKTVKIGLAKRGRFFVLSADNVNGLLGFNLLKN